MHHKYNNPPKKIKDFVDDEIDISYNNKFNTPEKKCEDSQQDESIHSNSTTKNREGETIVPPLALKNIGSGKNTQHTTTGKLTRTTMHTTQIRDKMPLNNLKNNVNNVVSNAESNENKTHKDTQDGFNAPKIEENQFESRTSRSGSSSSGYGYPLDDDVYVEFPKAQNHPMIPKLNFNGSIPLKGEPFVPKLPINQPKPAEKAPPPAVEKPSVPMLGLNLENIKKKDFQDEFMEKFDEYSKSWRDMIEQQRRF